VSFHAFEEEQKPQHKSPLRSTLSTGSLSNRRAGLTGEVDERVDREELIRLRVVVAASCTAADDVVPAV